MIWIGNSAEPQNRIECSLKDGVTHKGVDLIDCATLAIGFLSVHSTCAFIRSC